MFIVSQTKNKTITWPVTVEVAADGGKLAKHTFNGTFKVLDDEDRKALFPDAADTPKLDAEDISDDTQITATAIDWKEESVDSIMKIMTGWTGVADQARQPIEFTRENLLTAARSAVGVSLLRGINTAIAEIATGARAKN